ncbi:MAG: TIM barrel protein [Chloroflexales bacterium]|nr:TIM barrel protein [Chloroflexales bacterium]
MSKPTISIGNAPCSWGTLEFEGMAEQRIGYEQMLDELVETGYTGSELGDWGFMPTEPATLQAELKKRNLAMNGAFVPVALKNLDAHAPGEATALRTARLLAAVSANQAVKPFLVLADDNGQADPMRTRNAGRVTPAMGLPASEWRIFAQGAERIARAVRDETGLRTVFHHHCAGYVETPAEIACLLELTDPSLLGLVFDTGHYAYGAGADGCKTVIDGLDCFAERIWYLHFKDCNPHVAQQARANEWDYFTALQHGVFCELGQGCVDFPAVLQWLHKQGYQGYITVEQDVLPGMGLPKASALRNRAYLKGIGLE